MKQSSPFFRSLTKKHQTSTMHYREGVSAHVRVRAHTVQGLKTKTGPNGLPRGNPHNAVSWRPLEGNTKSLCEGALSTSPVCTAPATFPLSYK